MFKETSEHIQIFDDNFMIIGVTENNYYRTHLLQLQNLINLRGFTMYFYF